MFEMPPMLRGTEQEQLIAMRDYLVRLAISLNSEEGRKPEKAQEQDATLTAAQQADRKFNEVRELITYLNRLPEKHWPFKIRNGGTGAAVGKTADYNKALQIPEDWNIRVGTNALFLLPSASEYTYSMPCFGYITGSGKTVRLFFVPLYSLIRAGNLEVTAVASAAVRHSDGGYIGGSNDATLTTYIDESGRSGGTVYVDLVNDSGWGATNNTPVAGTATVTFTVPVATT